MSNAIDSTATPRTTADSWDWHWRRLRLPQLPRRLNPNVAFARRIVRRGIQGETRSLFEVGCAPGAWLGLFSRTTGLPVAGCDVSPIGVGAARENLRLLDVSGTVYEADIFGLSRRIPDRFGVVYSIGVVEHFDDLEKILRAHASMCEPGGRIVVLAPNLRGLSGSVFRRASKKLMRSHRVVTASQLEAAARAADLEPLDWGYGGPVSAFVFLDRMNGRVKRAIAYGLSLILAALTYPGAGPRLSGSVHLIARKRGDVAPSKDPQNVG